MGLHGRKSSAAPRFDLKKPTMIQDIAQQLLHKNFLTAQIAAPLLRGKRLKHRA
jgi:hypothetical protein